MSSFMEVGVDWITCSGSLEVSGADAGWLLLGIAGEEKKHESAFYGYKGWRQGHLFYGEKETKWLAQISGYPAADNWRGLFALADTCTRLDLQMTIRYGDDYGELVEEEYTFAVAQRLLNRAYPKLTLIKGDPTGDTFYMGDRSSDYFFRMYDKAAQTATPEYANCIRYELEVKGKRAGAVGQACLDANDEQRWMAGYIQGHLHSHGLFPPLPAMQSFLVEPRRLEAVPDERRLEWLNKQVSPTVQRLIARGRGGDVLQALGIIPDLDASPDSSPPTPLG